MRSLTLLAIAMLLAGCSAFQTVQTDVTGLFPPTVETWTTACAQGNQAACTTLKVNGDLCNGNLHAANGLIEGALFQIPSPYTTGGAIAVAGADKALLYWC